MPPPQPSPSALPQLPPSELAQRLLPAIDEGRIRVIVDRLAAFGTRHTLSPDAGESRGLAAASRWALAEFESYNTPSARRSPMPGVLRASFDERVLPPSTRVPQGATVRNVLATIPGTRTPDRWYYLIAHLDSIPSNVMDAQADAPGANDNASGCAAAMEIARILAIDPLESTVVIMLTSAEEQGLLGARAHADAAAQEKRDIRAVLNNDTIGDPLGPGSDPARTTRQQVRVLSEGLPRNPSAERLAQIRQVSGESDSTSRQLARFIADVAQRERTAVQPMLVFRADRFLRGGDHIAFNDAGFPAVRFCEVHEDYNRQHQNVRTERGPDGRSIEFGDLPQFVDAGYVADVARLNLASLIHLANAPSTPGRARIITARLETTTTIRWDASPEADTAGYEIVWRDTTSPQWTHAKDVGLVTEFTIDESKDNFFFGVRAYDADGYRSPVAFCGAARE